jgi:iron(III) transport system substrate-binding protein
MNSLGDTRSWVSIGLFFLGLMLATANAFAASPSLKQAKQEADARGYFFLASHDEIVAEAKKEGSLRALVGAGPDALKAIREGFNRKYPFLKLHIEEISGTDAAQRFLMEMKVGTASGWDVVHLSQDFYAEYFPYLEKVDLLGMAEGRVLKIPPMMIDPKNRNTLAAASGVVCIGYNKKLLPSDRVPKSWEDLLKPEFKGRKFFVDIRPYNIAALVPGKGLEWVVDYSRKLAAQEPVWVRGFTRAMTAMAAGEYALHSATNYQAVMREKEKGGRDLEAAVVEPIPVRTSLVEAIAKGAKRRHAALLFIEYMAGPEAQKALDEIEPLESSIYFPGSKLEQLIRGKRTSVIDWDHYQKLGSYMKQISEAFGFPKAEAK